MSSAAMRANSAHNEGEESKRETPCDEVDVHALLDHITMVVRRSCAIGNGAHFSSVEQAGILPQRSGLTSRFPTRRSPPLCSL